MTKREELNLFLLRADEFIEGKYILADIKIVNLLKSIAGSDTLIAIFKNCLDGFDFEEAKRKYLIDSKFQSENRGEFILPLNSRELLALIFNLLLKFDSKEIEFSDFLSRYFFEDGSFSSSYSAFVNGVIKPFRDSLNAIMESVIEGKLQDPIEAFCEAEKKKEEEKQKRLIEEEKNRELERRQNGENIKQIKEILLKDKLKVKEKKLAEKVEYEILLIIDMLANVVESNDKDAIVYAFTAYKYMVKAHGVMFFRRDKKIGSLIEGIINGL